MSVPSWLPDPIELTDHGGNWDEYLEHIYTCFCDDFHRSPITFDGQILSAKKHPELQGKSATFWHIISSGAVEDEKIPDLDRCKTVLWPRAIIENCSDPAVLRWSTNDYKGGARTLLWLKSCSYLVVIAHRGGYCMLWTAYIVRGNHTKRKLQQKYDAYTQNVTQNT